MGSNPTLGTNTSLTIFNHLCFSYSVRVSFTSGVLDEISTWNGSDPVSINATFITTDVATWSLPLWLLTHLISIT